MRHEVIHLRLGPFTAALTTAFREVADAIKGTVALMRAQDDSLERVDEVAPVRWIVFPRWRAGDAARFTLFSKAVSLIEISHRAMNYSLHGAQSFTLLGKILEKSDCYHFAYGDLNEAASAFDALAAAA